MCLASAWRQMAREKACVEAAASAVVRCSSSSSLVEGSQTIASTCGCPVVSVPVLSKQTVLIPAIRSRTSPLRNSTPRSAARPSAAQTAIGVARPSAQGQAMRTTDNAASSPRSHPPVRP